MEPIRTSQIVQGRQLTFYKCPFKDCPRKLSRLKDDITIHIRNHTGEKPFICNVCKKGYVSKSKLKYHSCAERVLEKLKTQKPFSESQNSHPSNMSEISGLNVSG